MVCGPHPMLHDFPQASDLIEVTRLCTGVLNGLAAEQVQVLKDLSGASEEAVKSQWGEEAVRHTLSHLKANFGTTSWADRMEKLEELVKRYQVSKNANRC